MIPKIGTLAYLYGGGGAGLEETREHLAMEEVKVVGLKGNQATVATGGVKEWKEEVETKAHLRKLT